MRCELKPECQVDFLDFARKRALRAQEQVLCELLGERAAALHDLVRPRVLHDRAQGAQHVDAKVIEEPPVLSCHRRLDQRVGDLLKRHRIGELDAALADLVAVAVEEGDAEFAAGAPVRVFGKLDGRQLEYDHNKEPAGSDGRRLRQDFHGKAPHARHAERGEEVIVVCPPVFKSGIKAVKGGVDPRIERQPVDVAAAPVRLENPVPHVSTPPPLNQFAALPPLGLLQRNLPVLCQETIPRNS